MELLSAPPHLPWLARRRWDDDLGTLVHAIALFIANLSRSEHWQPLLLHRHMY